MVRDSITLIMGRRHYIVVVVVELTFLGLATALYLLD